MKVKIIFKDEESKNYYISLLDAHKSAYKKNDETNTICLNILDINFMNGNHANFNIYLGGCVDLTIYIDDIKSVDFMVKG
jgi:hypothetical protein